MRTFLKDIKLPDGDFIELGVYNGNTLRIIKSMAGNRKVLAVDSFVGFPESSGHPLDDSIKYHKGRFDVGGKCPVSGCLVYKGFIPEILKTITETNFAFAHVDLDWYTTTLDTLNWLWPRMSKGGIIMGHDYSDLNIQAPQAYRDFKVKFKVYKQWAVFEKE